jgi:thiaminase (transcriptional activator TenA)
MLARFRSSLWPSGSISIGASRARQPLPDNFVHAEWITLHDNPDFRGFVDFLRTELDRVGPAQADLCRDFFRRAVALELSFFEAAYAERT